MDELLREFLTETNESLDVIDVELVRFERDPNNAKILDNIFRLVHTVKGTCGFLGLPRLQALAHSAETLMGRFRDGLAVTAEAVTLVLATIDRIKEILVELEHGEREPEGSDRDLIDLLERMAAGAAAESAIAISRTTSGSLVYQVLERPLRPGEVPLDEVERAFRETAGPADLAAAATLQRHRRAAGRGDENPHAAGWQCLAKIAAHGAGSRRRSRQGDRAGNARRRDRARPPGPRPHQGSAHPHGAQLRRPWSRRPRRAPACRQARERHDPALGLSRGRAHHHPDRRRRPRIGYRTHQGQGDCRRTGFGIRAR